jgi:hypothetical protein
MKLMMLNTIVKRPMPKKTVTNNESALSNKLADLFKQPVSNTPGYQWKAEQLSPREVKLLYYHQMFGHASLRHIRKIIKEKLGSGLSVDLPAGRIHCPVYAISKRTKFNSLDSTNREVKRLDIMAVDLIGPFQVDSVDVGKYSSRK